MIIDSGHLLWDRTSNLFFCLRHSFYCLNNDSPSLPFRPPPWSLFLHNALLRNDSQITHTSNSRLPLCLRLLFHHTQCPEAAISLLQMILSFTLEAKHCHPEYMQDNFLVLSFANGQLSSLLSWVLWLSWEWANPLIYTYRRGFWITKKIWPTVLVCV